MPDGDACYYVLNFIINFTLFTFVRLDEEIFVDFNAGLVTLSE